MRQGSFVQEFSIRFPLTFRIPLTSPCTLLRFNPLASHVFLTGIPTPIPHLQSPTKMSRYGISASPAIARTSWKTMETT